MTSAEKDETLVTAASPTALVYSRLVTAAALTAPGYAYQQTLSAAIHDGSLAELDIQVVHTALRDAIESTDPTKAEALDYLLEYGAPVKCTEDEEPYAFLAARQHNKPAYFGTLVALACASASFEATNGAGESAASLLDARFPEVLLLTLVKE